MFSVRLYNRFIRSFSMQLVTNQVQFIPKFGYNVKRRGYLVPVVYLQKQQIHNDVNNNVNHHNIYHYDKRQKIYQRNELSSYIMLLKIGLKDTKVDYAILLEALTIFAESDVESDNSTNIFLLSCCGGMMPDIKPEIRQKLLYHLWDVLKKKNYPFTFDYYHTFLNVCAENCEDINPREFIQSMTLIPNEDTYACLLNVSANTGNAENTAFIIMKLKEIKDSLNLDIINLLIKFYSKVNDMGSANFVLKNVIDSNIEVPNELFGSLACGYAQQGDIDNIIQLLEKYSISTKQLLQIIKNLSLANKGNDIENILQYIPAKKMLEDPFLVNFIIELTYLNKIDDCLLVLNFFLTKGFTRDTLRVSKHFFKTLAMGEASVPTILNISKQFSSTFGFPVVFQSLLQGSLIGNRTDLSFNLLEIMAKNNVEIKPHYYWPLFIQVYKKKGEPGIFEVIDHSVNIKVKLNWDTLFDYVIPNINILDPMLIFKALTEHGVHHYIVVTPLIKYCLENGKIQNANILLEKMCKIADFNELLSSLVTAYKGNMKDIDLIVQILLLPDEKKDYPGQFMCKAVIKGLFNTNIDAFEKLLSIYKTNNISISSFTANQIEKYAFRKHMEKMSILLKDANIINDENKQLVPNAERLSGTIHPKNMNEEQLECHLIELKSKGFNFHGVLRKLFMRYTKNTDFEKTNEVLAELEKHGIKLTPGMKSNLLELYARNGKAIEAYNLILDLKRNAPNWIIDNSKILATAEALLHQNELQKALQLIKESRVSSFSLQRPCWKLLNTAAQLKDPELVETFFNYFVEKKFSSVGTQILGPFIRVHLLRNDLKSAVETFKILARKYHKTPLHQELISVLIGEMKNNSTENSVEDTQVMLDEVIEIITKIYGMQQVVNDLLVAYARFDMLKQLKLILQDLAHKPINFNFIVGGMNEEEKQKVLLTILDVSHGIDGFNRSTICDLLLASYSNTSKINDALKLWQKIKGENINIPYNVKKKYSKTLESYGKLISNTTKNTQ